jgi:Helicase conserved C-terminal domain/Beta-lactamase
MVGDGTLDLDADIGDYLTSWQLPADAGWRASVTLRQLLAHTAGLSYNWFRGYGQDEPVPSMLQGQRLLFSATLDAGVDVLVRRYLTDPVTHSVDPSPAPVAVPHHLLHVDDRDRLAVLVDLAAAPGRTLVFARTKRRAKTLTRQLIQAGVPATELHGNLAQNTRSRNLTAFAAGDATTLVATDIAARGIHVDDVALVVHADPPAEYKAYLHRSGRTARAGATGMVVTLMTDDQVADVYQLARLAGITPTTTRLRPGHPVLGEIAPGPRTLVHPPAGNRAGLTPPARGGGTRRPTPNAKPRRRTRSMTSRAAGGGRTAGTSAGPKVSGAAAFSAGSRVGAVRRGGGRSR